MSHRLVFACLLFFFLSTGGGELHATEKDVVQVAVRKFPDFGKVTLRMIEKVGQAPTLEIIPSNRKGRMARFVMGRGDQSYRIFRGAYPDLNCRARFMVLNVPGFPAPLIVAIALTPGGSGHGFEMEVIGAVNGRFLRLSKKRLYSSNLGGFHVGKIPGGKTGVVVWNFDWDFDSEGHYSAHRFDFSIFGFNRQTHRLFLIRKVRTKKKYGGRGQEAARELKLKVHNLLDDIPEFKDFLED